MKTGIIGRVLWPWGGKRRKSSGKMRICVIGNSHVGALKRAWDEMGEGGGTGVEIDFFAHRGNGMSHLEVKEGRLVPGTPKLRAAMRFTSGGKVAIDPNRYDTVLLYAMGARALPDERDLVLSSQVRKAAVEDWAEASLLMNVLRKVRQISEVRILVGHSPLPSVPEVTDRGKPDVYLEGIATSNEIFYRRFGAELLPQPQVTIVNGRFTDPVYTKGSKRLAVGDDADDLDHPERDMSHMNEEFGKAWLSDFLAHLGK